MDEPVMEFDLDKGLAVLTRTPATLRGLVARGIAGRLRQVARRRSRGVAGLAPEPGAAGAARPAPRAGSGDPLPAARVLGGSRLGPHRSDLARDGKAVHGGRRPVEGLSARAHALAG